MAITIEEQHLPVTEGMKLVLSIIKLDPICELWGRGKSKVSNGVSHSMVNGKPYYFNEREVAELEKCVHDIGYTLLNTTLTTNRTEDSAYCKGLTVVDKLKTLGKTMRLPYIFFDQMHWTQKQKTMRLSQTDGASYNKFSAEHIEQINLAIRTAAYTLLGIHFVYEYPEE